MMSNLSVNNLSQSIYHTRSDYIPMQEVLGSKSYLTSTFSPKQNDRGIWE